ncbi:MAG: YraN family protein [Prevotella sp.]|nr:YraN family protein [Bacteroidales bacterium]MDY2693162.1 YraN family protein [Prevotella sp.]MDY6027210.1 YraN family protein [Prevotella sp.]
MAQHNELGAWGEQIAAAYLADKGMRILKRNWRDGHRDLDIVGYMDNMLVVVEVKTRRNDLFMDPQQAVDRGKARRICTAANRFVKYYHIDAPVRFDIVAIVGMPGQPYKIEHIEDAFSPIPYYY